MTTAQTFASQSATRLPARLSFYGPQIVAYLLFIAASIVDVCSPKISSVSFFAVSFLILAHHAKNGKQIWAYTLFFIVAVYTLYFIKYGIVLRDLHVPLWGFRLYNRTLAAIMYVLLSIAVQAWIYWQKERRWLDHLDRRDEDEINATTGMIGSVSLGLLILAVDCIAPLGYNLPVLFALPLYLASWANDRRALWLTTAMLILLIILGYFIYPSMAEPGLLPYAFANRVVIGSMLVVMTFVLQLGMKPEEAGHTA